jgi:Uma2 family endonuclease
VIAMTGLGMLFGMLRGKSCQPFNSDTKVRIELSGQTRFYYPDAMVVCHSNPLSDHKCRFPGGVWFTIRPCRFLR